MLLSFLRAPPPQVLVPFYNSLRFGRLGRCYWFVVCLTASCVVAARFGSVRSVCVFFQCFSGRSIRCFWTCQFSPAFMCGFPPSDSPPSLFYRLFTGRLAQGSFFFESNLRCFSERSFLTHRRTQLYLASPISSSPRPLFVLYPSEAISMSLFSHKGLLAPCGKPFYPPFCLWPRVFLALLET